MKIELSKSELTMIENCIGCYQKENDKFANDPEAAKRFPKLHQGVKQLQKDLQELKDKIFINRTA